MKNSRYIILAILILVALPFSGQNLRYNYVMSETMLDSTGIDKFTSIQYFDGYNRQIENASSGSTDYIYSCLQYDQAGRKYHEWKPLKGNSDPDYILQPSDLATDTYGDEYAYNEILYDGINRDIYSRKAGEDLYDMDKYVTKQYLINSGTSVKKYKAPIGSISLVDSGYYAAGTLNEILTTDEDGHTVAVFKDNLERVVLERRDKNNDTYYVYDELGDLRYVLSPQYQLQSNKSMYAYEYCYDERHRVVKKILPGCEYIQYWYNKSNQLMFMQDALLRKQSLYRFMLYDGLGRLAIQGTCSDCNRNNSYYVHVTFTPGQSGICNTGYILSKSGIISDSKIETVNYYDNYDFLASNIVSQCSNQSILTKTSPENATGLLTGNINMTSNGEILYNVSYYDYRGRNVDMRTIGLNGNVVRKTNSYTFTGNVASSILELSNIAGNPQKIQTDNVYERVSNKLSLSKLSVNNNDSHTINNYNYDGIGRLSSNTRSGNAGTVSYCYNIRGGLTGIESPSFEEALYYSNYNCGFGTPCYNGNISSMQWKTGNETDIRGYKFTYDGLNRLTTATYGEREDMSSNVGRYDEKITGYTANSAITGLQRNGKLNNRTYGLVDDLDITLNGNQLSRITDKVIPMLYVGASDFKDNTMSVTCPEYMYNGNGALVWDANKGITKIEYDNMNNPKEIHFTNGNVVEYIYSASGEKLRTIHRTAVSNLGYPIGVGVPLPPYLTLSVDSTDYIGNFIFHNGKVDKFLFNGGYCSFTSDNQPVYHYYTQDHLGNNRAVVNENGTLEQVNHYYPFGDVYADAGLNVSAQPYKYNGKELDRMYRLDWYDYGARDYDAVVPMWTSRDPLCEKKPWLSPYVYCSGNPVNRIDPDGRDDYRMDRDGNMTLVKQTDAENHTIYATNSKGGIDNKNSVQVSKDVLSSKITVPVKTCDSNGNTSTAQVEVFTAFGDKQSTAFFEFAAKNSDVEWTQVKAMVDGAQGYEQVNYIGTSHTDGNDASQSFILSFVPNGVTVREANHDHPNNTTTVSQGDINVATKGQSRFPNATFNIFTPGDSQYTPYNMFSVPGLLKEIIITPSK